MTSIGESNLTLIGHRFTAHEGYRQGLVRRGGVGVLGGTVGCLSAASSASYKAAARNNNRSARHVLI